jgi:exodeoxyribonuclease VII large subunit
VLADLRATLSALAARLDRAAARGLALRRERAQLLARRLPQPRSLLALPSQRADDVADRLPRALAAAAGHWRARAEAAGAALRPALIATARDRAARDLATHGTALLRALTARQAAGAALLAQRSAALRPLLVTRRREAATARLEQAGRLLESLGPNQVLARGYALVIGPDGKLVTTAAAAAQQPRLTIRFADGDTPAIPGTRPVQGSLF